MEPQTDPAVRPKLRAVAPWERAPAPSEDPGKGNRDRRSRKSSGEEAEATGRRGRRPLRRALPLGAVLVFQTVVSACLLGTNTAFLDEATYLYAGHAELDHLLHGAPVEAYQGFFSGAPVLYPVAGAVADHFGGLAGARLLGLAFILIATVLLHGMTRRLFDRTAAFFAAALWAVLGPTFFLSAFATFDAPALALLALAAWFVVSARDARRTWPLLVLAAAAMVLADTTKYAAGIFDPVVIVLAVLVLAPRHGPRRAVLTGAGLAAAVAAVLVILVLVAGPDYRAGISSTTTSRPSGGDAIGTVVSQSWHAVGVLAVIAGVGLLLRFTEQRTVAMAGVSICALLAVAILLAPADQARIHTTTSLYKHVDFGAWFAAAVAGYAFARILRFVRRRWAAPAVTVLTAAVIGPMALAGVHQGDFSFHQWPNSAAMTTALGPIGREVDAQKLNPQDLNLQNLNPQNLNPQYLVEDVYIAEYYLRNQVTWYNWHDTYYLAYTDPDTGERLMSQPAYIDAIRHHYFAVVVLDDGSTAALDARIVATMEATRGYRLVRRVGSHTAWGPMTYQIWVYEPDRD